MITLYSSLTNGANQHQSDTSQKKKIPPLFARVRRRTTAYRSFLENPAVWINFICFRIVDFPLSPAPEHANTRCQLPISRTNPTDPHHSPNTSDSRETAAGHTTATTTVINERHTNTTGWMRAYARSDPDRLHNSREKNSPRCCARVGCAQSLPVSASSPNGGTHPTREA